MAFRAYPSPKTRGTFGLTMATMVLATCTIVFYTVHACKNRPMAVTGYTPAGLHRSRRPTFQCCRSRACQGATPAGILKAGEGRDFEAWSTALAPLTWMSATSRGCSPRRKRSGISDKKTGTLSARPCTSRRCGCGAEEARYIPSTPLLAAHLGDCSADIGSHEVGCVPDALVHVRRNVGEGSLNVDVHGLWTRKGSQALDAQGCLSSAHSTLTDALQAV